MKNQKNRPRSVVGTLLLLTGTAFVAAACGPIVAEMGLTKQPSEVTVRSADYHVADAGVSQCGTNKGAAR